MYEYMHKDCAKRLRIQTFLHVSDSFRNEWKKYGPSGTLVYVSISPCYEVDIKISL